MAGNRKTALQNMKKARAAKTSPGRKPGSKNKLRANVVEEILDVHEALKKKGKGLLDCAMQDPKWFLSLFLKGLIPKNIDFNLGVDDDTLKIIFERIENKNK